MHSVIFILLRRMRLPLITLVCVYAISILGLVLIPGQDAQGQPWNMGFFHAFYFVSFMGSTIGFGEVPYPFTDAQRLWTTFSIYFTVFAWLFAIGNMLKIIQDPIFKQLLSHTAFNRGMGRITQPFYLICGYGDTGSNLVRRLSDHNIQSVVVDIEQDRINSLEIDSHIVFNHGLCADATKPEVLVQAGLQHPLCSGIVALTNQDHSNLAIAITAKLLNPDLRVICRAETHDAAANMASFGTNHIINPFDTFAHQLATALYSSGMHLLYVWLTSEHHAPASESISPPHGNWVLCGYGRFGKAIYRNLLSEEINTTVIEAIPEITGLPQGGITGRGTEADTLLQANIETANAIIAGTDDDANNLSIIMTAKELNPRLFTIARQNERNNDAIFMAANIDIVMKKGDIISREILSLLTNPLLSAFLRLLRHQDDDWTNILVSRLSGIIGDHPPDTWVIEVTAAHAPALHDAIREGKAVRLADIYKDPADHTRTLTCIPLLIKRETEQILLPTAELSLHTRDAILFAGIQNAEASMRMTCSNHNTLRYVLTGIEKPSGTIWQKIDKLIKK